MTSYSAIQWPWFTQMLWSWLKTLDLAVTLYVNGMELHKLLKPQYRFLHFKAAAYVWVIQRIAKNFTNLLQFLNGIFRYRYSAQTILHYVIVVSSDLINSHESLILTDWLPWFLHLIKWVMHFRTVNNWPAKNTLPRYFYTSVCSVLLS